ncbi:hypothetical protein P8891_06370 [Bacillus atrophaeus]|uniref:hypothetical protein n=1 Tax=Bacillus atrophaeus TaxID=1452 RepID=UPI0022820693|nr:hypothetical protein [Bacillus atrophaeus]MCY7947995.1 hypothetical protein [Bacillus atrophaeus]MCY8098059.1 hypothetical protein [Bacillus atrophaeus]MCY9169983.1 hypothetical protein [Bacillus atrophaeus]MEC0740709.1 hypothetical protein [Bacillus atrophaeus]MEC0747028.1 hypothetical protein [Bacillus atrophaeus]
MIIAAWLLLVLFGYYVLSGVIVLWVRGLTVVFTLIWFLAVFICALSGGIIWGGLFQ